MPNVLAGSVRVWDRDWISRELKREGIDFSFTEMDGFLEVYVPEDKVVQAQQIMRVDVITRFLRRHIEYPVPPPLPTPSKHPILDWLRRRRSSPTVSYHTPLNHHSAWSLIFMDGSVEKVEALGPSAAWLKGKLRAREKGTTLLRVE